MTTIVSRTPRLDAIAEHGNHPDRGPRDNNIKCRDGFELSVIAGTYAYCTPRPGMGYDVPDDYSGPYGAVEVGFPSARPEPWEPVDGPLCWSAYADDAGDPTGTVYGYVPVSLVRALIVSHGGEA